MYLCMAFHFRFLLPSSLLSLPPSLPPSSALQEASAATMVRFSPSPERPRGLPPAENGIMARLPSLRVSHNTHIRLCAPSTPCLLLYTRQHYFILVLVFVASPCPSMRVIRFHNPNPPLRTHSFPYLHPFFHSHTNRTKKPSL